MQNAQRPNGNAALDAAIRLGNEHGVGVVVYFGLDRAVPHASARTFTFLLDGLRETLADIRARGVETLVRAEPPVEGVARLASGLKPVAVVTDFSPLRRGRGMRAEASARIDVPLYVVDGEHVVPVRTIGREHWAARTIRPVIHRALPTWLVEPERVEPNHRPPALDGRLAGRRGDLLDGAIDLDGIPTAALLESLGVDPSVPPAIDAESGPRAACARHARFIAERLTGYATRRRESDGAGAGISPYLRYGQVSPLRLALDVQASGAPWNDRDAYLDELIVRRELASNYCLYNRRYWTVEGLPAWARATLEKHADDPRPHVYTRDALAAAATHDEIWNAAQRELLVRGRIHNHVRMYWGKKILEWSPDPAIALASALWLNDRYGLDGRSANGFTNVAWCFGKHDRPWAERPIFGTVRYMSENGMRAKFDVKGYVGRWGAPTDASAPVISFDPRQPSLL